MKTSRSVVAAWTHIPVSRMLEGEREKLLKMEERLQQRVIGQKAGHHRRVQRRAPFAQRIAGSEPADRLVHFSRPDRRGQDRDGPRAGGIFVRRRERHDSDRHERIHGEAHRCAAHRRAAGLRRLRGRRAVERGGAAQTLFGDSIRRDREGAQRRVQRAVAGAR